MTEEEFSKVKFRMDGHIALEYEHICSYQNEDGRLGYCDHTPKKEDGTFGKGYRHYRIDDKVYKTRAKFLEALKDFNPTVKLVLIRR